MVDLFTTLGGQAVATGAGIFGSIMQARRLRKLRRQMEIQRTLENDRDLADRARLDQLYRDSEGLGQQLFDDQAAEVDRSATKFFDGANRLSAAHLAMMGPSTLYSQAVSGNARRAAEMRAAGLLDARRESVGRRLAVRGAWGDAIQGADRASAERRARFNSVINSLDDQPGLGENLAAVGGELGGYLRGGGFDDLFAGGGEPGDLFGSSYMGDAARTGAVRRLRWRY